MKEENLEYLSIGRRIILKWLWNRYLIYFPRVWVHGHPLVNTEINFLVQGKVQNSSTKRPTTKLLKKNTATLIVITAHFH